MKTTTTITVNTDTTTTPPPPPGKNAPNDGIANAPPALVVGVEVHLVAARVRTPVRPPLHKLGLLHFGEAAFCQGSHAVDHLLTRNSIFIFEEKQKPARKHCPR